MCHGGMYQLQQPSQERVNQCHSWVQHSPGDWMALLWCMLKPLLHVSRFACPGCTNGVTIVLSDCPTQYIHLTKLNPSSAPCTPVQLCLALPGGGLLIMFAFLSAHGCGSTRHRRCWALPSALQLKSELSFTLPRRLSGTVHLFLGSDPCRG